MARLFPEPLEISRGLGIHEQTEHSLCCSFLFLRVGLPSQAKALQAWQVINTAQGKGGSGGRLEALQELNVDRIPLVGVDVSGAFLQGATLANARFFRAN